MWSRELVALQEQYPEISKQVDFYKVFEDWDGSSGAFLPLKDPWVVSKANYLIGRYNPIDKPKKQAKPATTKTKKSGSNDDGQLCLF